MLIGQSRKSGFTLVELSIVLVIFGLLIGGVLIGQNIIENVKLKKTISNLSQYDIAFNNFKIKFKQLPGDSNLFSPSGNNDGRIRGRWGNAYWHGEDMGAYWHHLSLGMGLDKVYQPVVVGSTSYVKTGLNYPNLPMNEDASITAITRDWGWWNFPFTLDEPVYWIAELSKTQLRDDNDGLTNWALTPLQAQTLDKKIDDGHPWLGKAVSAGSGHGLMHDTANWNCITCCAMSVRRYRIEDNRKLCTMMIKIGHVQGYTE